MNASITFDQKGWLFHPEKRSFNWKPSFVEMIAALPEMGLGSKGSDAGSM